MPVLRVRRILTLAVSITAQGQARGRGAAAHGCAARHQPRDLQGVWSGGLRTDSKPKLRAVAQKIFDDNTEELRRKLPVTKDPVFWCTPAGVPHVYDNGVHPFEILQTPARTFLFYESDRTWRTVWTDGRSMPDDVSDLWMGYSIGRWEGNEFVVETAGFNDKTWVLQGEGTTHSTKLRSPNASGAWAATTCRSNSRSPTPTTTKVRGRSSATTGCSRNGSSTNHSASLTNNRSSTAPC